MTRKSRTHHSPLLRPRVWFGVLLIQSLAVTHAHTMPLLCFGWEAVGHRVQPQAELQVWCPLMKEVMERGLSTGCSILEYSFNGFWGLAMYTFCCNSLKWRLKILCLQVARSRSSTVHMVLRLQSTASYPLWNAKRYWKGQDQISLLGFITLLTRPSSYHCLQRFACSIPRGTPRSPPDQTECPDKNSDKQQMIPY